MAPKWFWVNAALLSALLRKKSFALRTCCANTRSLSVQAVGSGLRAQIDHAAGELAQSAPKLLVCTLNS